MKWLSKKKINDQQKMPLWQKISIGEEETSSIMESSTHNGVSNSPRPRPRQPINRQEFNDTTPQAKPNTQIDHDETFAWPQIKYFDAQPDTLNATEEKKFFSLKVNPNLMEKHNALKREKSRIFSLPLIVPSKESQTELHNNPQKNTAITEWGNFTRDYQQTPMADVATGQGNITPKKENVVSQTPVNVKANFAQNPISNFNISYEFSSSTLMAVTTKPKTSTKKINIVQPQENKNWTQDISENSFQPIMSNSEEEYPDITLIEPAIVKENLQLEQEYFSDTKASRLEQSHNEVLNSESHDETPPVTASKANYEKLKKSEVKAINSNIEVANSIDEPEKNLSKMGFTKFNDPEKKSSEVAKEILQKTNFSQGLDPHQEQKDLVELETNSPKKISSQNGIPRIEMDSDIQDNIALYNEKIETNLDESQEKLHIEKPTLFSPTPLRKNKSKKLVASAEDSASITPKIKLDFDYNIEKTLLNKNNPTNHPINPLETQSVIKKLENTLKTFGIEGRVMGMQRGPIITRFEVKMAPGIKVSKIAGLTDELAMALEALRVRIEAPIPGRSTVGIEIPNKKRSQVLLGEIINDSSFLEFDGALPLPMGKDIAGNLVVEDLSKMPHILIAGATGSGKSVLVNSFIVTLIMKKSPEQLRFILIDPKLVELSHYNDIPHLLHPVITDAPKAIQALNWVVEEMDRRYEDMADWRARDLAGYNEKIEAFNDNLKQNREDRLGKPKNIMPHIVVLIDELGDLMMVAGKDVESSIIRISQKARAVGIHLILATQRPSVDVITALIKANCPARIALQVSQKTDSRTILDSNGAETLLGRGDFLFKHPSKGQLVRTQAPFVSDEEVEKVVLEAKKISQPKYITLDDPKSNMAQLEGEDELLFDEAWDIILESQKTSASYLQRRLRIGYNRAARLIEALEARGYIGPQIGSKPREILVA